MSFKKISVFILLLFTFYFLLSFGVFAQQPPGYNLPPLPGGTGLTQGEIQGLLVRFANFLIAAGVILAIITIVISGIMYFKAGSDTEAKSAKGWLRNGIIGAIIILAVGVIILTIYNIVVNRSFFGGTPVPGGVPGGQVPAGQVPGAPGGETTVSTGGGTRDIGNRCVNDSDCRQDRSLVCSPSTKVCRRVNGNLAGESCQDTTDCLAGNTCGRSIGTLFFGKQCRSSSAVSGQCQLTRILTDKTSVAAGESIRITVVASDAENCGGESITLSVCQGTSCNTIENGTFGTSTFTKEWSVTGISQPTFYFRTTIGSSSVRSTDIRMK